MSSPALITSRTLNSPTPVAPLAAPIMSTISGENIPVAAALAASAAAWAAKISLLLATPLLGIAASPAASAAASTASVPPPNNPSLAPAKVKFK